jgi:hypothetical protein
MLRIADIAMAAGASARINIVRENGAGPLLRMNRRATDVAAVFVRVFSAVAGAGLVSIQAKVVQAEAVMASRAAPRGL